MANIGSSLGVALVRAFTDWYWLTFSAPTNYGMLVYVLLDLVTFSSNQALLTQLTVAVLQILLFGLSGYLILIVSKDFRSVLASYLAYAPIGALGGIAWYSLTESMVALGVQLLMLSFGILCPAYFFVVLRRPQSPDDHSEARIQLFNGSKPSTSALLETRSFTYIVFWTTTYLVSALCLVSWAVRSVSL